MLSTGDGRAADAAPDAVTVATAIPVPEPFAAELRDVRHRLGDPIAMRTPTHLTLLGPTDVDEPTLAAYQRHLAGVAAEQQPFDVHLRGTATFRPTSPVVFVALAEGISSCEQLAGAVRTGPVRREHDYPYHPHVTIAHNITDEALDQAFAEMAGYEAYFEVTGFTLYEYVAGYWRAHRAYPFGGTVGAADGAAPQE